MENDKIIKKFIGAFKTEHLQGTELRVSSAEVRQFLQEHSVTMTFNGFNKKTHCLGRSTGNDYIYSIPVLHGILAEEKEDRKERAFASSRIKTLSWYGSKRNWLKEWEILLEVVAQEQKCRKVVDAFGGSGFISLLAARTGLYRDVILNDSSSLIFNFHSVMRDSVYFEQFITQLEAMGSVSKETFNLLYSHLHGTESSIAGMEQRRQVRSISVSKAVELFVTRHYSYDGQGSYVERRKKPAAYVESLCETHKLYGGLELMHHHYLKLLKKHMEEANTLIVLDPPYLKGVRVQKESYGKEFSCSQHRSLLQVVTKEPVNARVILCGYESALYTGYFLRAEQTWHCLRFKRPSKRACGTEGKEHIWFNFEVPESLINKGDLFTLVIVAHIVKTNF